MSSVVLNTTLSYLCFTLVFTFYATLYLYPLHLSGLLYYVYSLLYVDWPVVIASHLSHLPPFSFSLFILCLSVTFFVPFISCKLSVLLMITDDHSWSLILYTFFFGCLSVFSVQLLFWEASPWKHDITFQWDLHYILIISNLTSESEGGLSL